MTLSDALRWAWADELPKMAGEGGGAAPNGYSSAWGAILRFGELHSIVDRQPNRFGCIPFDQAGWPHADALTIAHHVETLAECEVDVPEAWNPMPELSAAVDAGLAGRAISDALERATVERGGLRYFRTRPDVLIVRHAILGLVPDWRPCQQPEVKFETWENGRHRWYVRRQVRVVEGKNADGTDYIVVHNIEADGWSSRLQRPVTGAYRKPYLEPDPVPGMVARAEYEIYCAAMAMLFEALAGELETIDLVAVDLPAHPWAVDSGEEAGESREPKILPDLRGSIRSAPSRNRRAKSKTKGGAKSPAIPA
ncbi:MAG: hypothetical protein LCH86_07630 [Proteobacteria bacterium]|nr:hypothetical protein [Pseudomonadota bacterium]